MILFVVSVDIRLNENLLFILNFVLVFMLGWKAIFLIMELIVSFSDDTEVSSAQLKRFNESVIDPKFLLEVETTSFCFDNNLSISSNIIFYCIMLFLLEKYDLHAFQNGLALQWTLSFSKYCNLSCLFRFATKFRCPLTHYVLVLPSYRNQSIDLLCKSIDWFLYQGNTGT